MAKSRKRAATAEAPAETTSPDVFDQAIAAQQNPATPIVQELAEQTRLPDANEREAAHENGHAARHQPHRAEGQSHAEAVGRRQPRYNEQGKTDYVVGARLLEHHDPYLSVIRFDEKPSEAIRGMMREAGFTFRAENKEWTRPINFDARIQDRLHAERTFDEVTKALREERGINHGYGGVTA
jgi:hypothetical protein